MENNKSSDKKMVELGAFWMRSSASGDYFSGNVTIDGKKTEIIAFKNKFKSENERAPDYRIYLSEPRPNTVSKPAAAKPQVKKPVKPSAPVEDPDDNDVNF